ncbi:MAG: UDP-glucose/GDP-mannose dehydrogenase family protein [Pseudomonadales bacterium]|nr:UDP-glucose/GDP-mannose dehydrogenase family protein [Candidatus Woesebacteria bacterium]MCB9802222.1 UDP-glucose/GDP-mannose dehydrogenase family protein [Pseudomonadales bacterium]
MQIVIIGTGFVGVVSAAVYASFGHTVYGLDIDEHKITSLKQSKVPFFEPGLSELLTQQQENGNLHFTTSYKEAITDADVVIIAVGTPSRPDGSANLSYIYAAGESMAPYLKENAVVVIKSTVPPGTMDGVTQTIKEHTSTPLHFASLPEFLKEGSAVADTLKPDRVVIGSSSEHAKKLLSELHEPLGAPIVHTSIESAQMSKYAANAYLASRINFINEIANLCEINGAHVQEVINAMGYDKRIGHHYWYPGLGFGGSCFPKDVAELASYSKEHSLDANLFVYLDAANTQRIQIKWREYTQLLDGWQGKTVAVLGLAFKPNTDDMRVAPSLVFVPQLLEAGALVRAYDPKATPTAKQLFEEHERLIYADTITQAITDADIIILLTEWDEIVQFDFSKHTEKEKQQWIIDTRNRLNKATLEQAGYHYVSIGS